MKVCDHQNYKGVAVLEISGGGLSLTWSPLGALPNSVYYDMPKPEGQSSDAAT